ncbi:hypothetical protein B0H11DRAFT_1924109 [Mycena galericulata]|nr:hypothetical protein B0H11DRAFT_1924109 [Mycena galericulata]
MKTNTDKHSHRFSPLAAHNGPPSTSHPRRASQWATIHNKSQVFILGSESLLNFRFSSLFSSQPLFFLPIDGVEVSNSMSDLDVLSPPSSPPRCLEKMYEDVAPEFELGANSWSDSDMEKESDSPEMLDTTLSKIPECRPSPTPLSLIKMEPLDEIPSAVQSLTVPELTTFEQWVVTRIRDAHSKGDSIVDGLRAVEKRSRAMEEQNNALRQRLDQIKSISSHN